MNHIDVGPEDDPIDSSLAQPAPLSVYQLSCGLRKLDELRADGTLDAAEYQRRRDKLIGNPQR